MITIIFDNREHDNHWESEKSQKCTWQATASGLPALAVYDVADFNTIWVPAITIAGHQYVLVQLHHRGSALDIRGGINKTIFLVSSRLQAVTPGVTNVRAYHLGQTLNEVLHCKLLWHLGDEVFQNHLGGNSESVQEVLRGLSIQTFINILWIQYTLIFMRTR